MSTVWQVKPYDYRVATEAEFAALNAFSRQTRAEIWPEDPPPTLEETINQFKSIPSFVEVHIWAVWNSTNDAIIATGDVALWHAEHNQHLAQFDITVLPEYRRQGIAKTLLPFIMKVAKRTNRRLLIGATSSIVPAGEAFMRWLHAQVGMETRTNQLDLSELNQTLIENWLRKGERASAAFEMGIWEGTYPEEELETIVAMMQVMNTQPFEQLEIEDMKWTPEQLRQMEAHLREQKVERWTLYVRHRESGEIAGYTETFWSPNRPEIVQQGDTGVFPKYRNHGLGRWLKAAMVEKILRERPSAKYLRTGNANSNAPMLKINEEMGFKPHRINIMWQVEVR
jgi:mycothiol synthase